MRYTEHQVQVEMAYRFQERLGQLCENRVPTKEETAEASDEAEAWADWARRQ